MFHESKFLVRQMGSSGGVSEIVESGEELNLGNYSNRPKPIRVKLREDEGKCHNYPVDNDLSHLIEAINLRTSPRILGTSCQMANGMKRKDSTKMLIKGGASHELGYGISESVTLKQALRRLCISQASELAAMKRSSKPIGLSGVSEAGTIKRLFSSVIVEGSNSDLSVGEVKTNLLEASIAPKSMALSQVCGACNTELSSKKAVSSPYSPTLAPIATKTRIQDVISSPSKTDSPLQNSASTSNTIKTRIQDVIATPSTRSRGHSMAVSEPGMKRKSNTKASKSGSETEKGLNKPCMIPLTKPTFRNNFSFIRKGRQEYTSSLGNSERILKVEEPGKSPSKTKLGIRKLVSATSEATKPGDANGTKNKDNVDECVSNLDNCSPGKTTGARMNKTQRAREKGDCSQSSISSLGDYSSSTSVSGESNQSGSSGSAIRPHMSKDIKWVAIRRVLNHFGGLGLMNFKLIKKLGCGDIGTVYLAELTGSGCLFALKVMDVEFLLSRKKILRAQSEREILQMLDHPFLPTLYAHFSTDNLSCLVMEFCPGGDLHVLRQKQPGRRFSEPAARFYVAEVLLALEYLHMLGVIYRDLKPENILVREDGHIMLSDFDLSLRCTVSPTLLRSSSLGREEEAAKKMSGPCAESSCINPNCQVSCFTPRLLASSMNKNRRAISDSTTTQVSPLPQLVVEPTDARSNSFVGTHEYLAPEIIKGDGHGSAVDWWTYGIFLYELIYGRTPFKGSGNEETLANVVCQSLKFPETPTASIHAMDLIKGLLAKDPEHRLGSVKGAAEIKRHPFFEGLNWALIRCAAPPEVPGGFDPGTPLATSKKKEESSEPKRRHAKRPALNLRYCHPLVPSSFLFKHAVLRRFHQPPPPHRCLRFSQLPFSFLVLASSSSTMATALQSAEASKPPFSVLFVCLGNICRSPAAEAVFTDIVRKRGLESKFKIDSAGIIGYHEGNPADSRMRAAAKKRGIEVTSISRPVRPSDFRDFDLILAMDFQNRDDLLGAFERWNHKEKLPKDAYKKVKLMCSYCKKHSETEVPDPYYGGPQGFEKVLDMLEDGCEALLDSILSENS